MKTSSQLKKIRSDFETSVKVNQLCRSKNKVKSCFACELYKGCNKIKVNDKLLNNLRKYNC